MQVEESAVLLPGPWTHRDVAARSARFHVAELGEGPLVVLLHGFPQFWWTWRDQLVALGRAGYRAVAPDLRGYGASDKPPRGYDAMTLADDVAGLVGALGERSAVLVGHGWGGLGAWTTAAVHPEVVAGLAVLAAPHPLQARESLLRSRTGQLRAARVLAGLQLPRTAESWLTRRGAANVGRLLRAWSGTPGWPDAATTAVYRRAMLVPNVAHSSLEYHRWLARSQLRPDGARFARRVGEPVRAPTLHLLGRGDPLLLAGTTADTDRYVAGGYRRRELPTGHFPHEEAPERVTAELLGWLPLALRDRDDAGRARNARPRDPTGRPLARTAGGAPGAPADQPAPPAGRAVAEADRLLAAGRPFAAHELLEAVWKATEGADRELWRGLAQLAVGLTHAQRGNATGAVRLLRRGAERVAAHDGPAPGGLAAERVATQARRLADEIEAGAVDLSAAADRLRLGGPPAGAAD